MKKILFFISLFIIPVAIIAQSPQTQKVDPVNGLVKWLSIEQAVEKNKSLPKPIMIDFYTNWCGWCKHMMKTTYSNKGIASYINANFYPVKFNAETKDTIKYRDKIYVNKGVGRKPTHDLAIKLMGGRLSYPTTLFISNNFQFNLKVPGYLDAKKIEPVLVYTLENVYKTTVYDDFEKNYRKTYHDSLKQDSEIIKWHSLEEAVKLNKKEKKKILIYIYTDWCNSCRVLQNSSLNYPINAKYLNEKYYTVKINAQTKEPIRFKEQTFVNAGSSKNNFHQFVLSALNNSIVLPSMIIMNEQEQIINRINYYMSPKNTKQILKYFGEDIYKITKWVDYQKSLQSKVGSSQPASEN